MLTKPAVEQNPIHPIGRHFATPIALRLAAIGETPVCIVTFKTDHGTLSWYGWLTPRAMPNTLRALRTLGFQSTTVDALSQFKPTTPVEIVVKHATVDAEYSASGRTYVRAEIAWINELGSAGTRETELTADHLAAIEAALASDQSS